MRACAFPTAAAAVTRGPAPCLPHPSGPPRSSRTGRAELGAGSIHGRGSSAAGSRHEQSPGSPARGAAIARRLNAFFPR